MDDSRGVFTAGSGSKHWESERTKSQCGIGAAEAEGIGQRGADCHIARDVWNKIEIAFGIAMKKVRRRRRDLIAYREHREDRLDAACGAKQMSGHGLRRRDREPRRVIAEAA